MGTQASRGSPTRSPVPRLPFTHPLLPPLLGDPASCCLYLPINSA
ncbi:hypothetical protein K5549_007562 [Capra hircus]|nr:hypothetical protein K5549_007562 [Capra hircus]